MQFVFWIFILCMTMSNSVWSQVTRGDTAQKKIALVFTGDEYADGGKFIVDALKKEKVRASFFLTGNFYRNASFKDIIQRLIDDGHYLGSHSDKHLLYCDWGKRDSLLVTKKEFDIDLERSYEELARWGISKDKAPYFLPPYEWYNDSIVKWTKQNELQLVCFSPGTRSTADYSYPEMGARYVSRSDIFNSILNFEKKSTSGLNGFILLIHIGTDPRRKDKFYHLLPGLLSEMKLKGYEWVRIDELLK
ncbi:MAG: polysaccharide deacetylase family protein [Ferruginibacter sp.]